MTPALIRCAGETKKQAIDIMVQSDGSITYLGICLSSICRDILWGHNMSLQFLKESDPEKRIRFGHEENLGTLVFGLLWPHFDKVESLNLDGEILDRRHSHNKFVIGRVDDKNLERAYYVYHLEFRQYPEPYLDFKNPKRVWINITNDRLETIFEGWPEDVLSMATAQAKIDEQEQDELEDESAEDTQRQDD
ncbi:hypothetical protein V0M98_37390 (plasmid) [Pseudomonas silesiensis]|uniref:hypothetical protein n=1 Tax=Pseudomonas silesiensis TaxID=1853130 RepID=UPI0030D1A394